MKMKARKRSFNLRPQRKTDVLISLTSTLTDMAPKQSGWNMNHIVITHSGTRVSKYIDIYEFHSVTFRRV